MRRVRSPSYPLFTAIRLIASAAARRPVVMVLLLSSTGRAEVDFEREVAPLLVYHCLECHSETDPSGGLRLTRAAWLIEGGDSGPAIDAGKPEHSLILRRILDGEMPPPKNDTPQQLTVEDKSLLRQWILSGGSWPEDRVLDPYEYTTDSRAGRDWWSLQPVQRPHVSVTDNLLHLNTNPVDYFIQKQLDEQNWVPAPQADRWTLLRRLSYDLTGLAPTVEQYSAFEQDSREAAWERQVNKLLASGHYGERWGRYWLDLARYADTCGYERDQEKPGVWKYRDWVIRSLNEDIPYDRFVLEQLAGDELPGRDENTVTATGFLRLGTWNDEPNNPQHYKYERLEDMVHATCTAFLGLTVKCARCHDHKFDPIPQTDYYRVANAFWAGFIEPRSREHLGGPSSDELGFKVFGWTDRGREVPPLQLLKNGDPRHPGPVIEPGSLTAVSWLVRPVALPPAGVSTTQRRLHLARWIIDHRNPLTARVVVNRLWLHHFGKGLVRTPNDFGFNGDQPTHPQLLDWLAHELIHPNNGTQNPERDTSENEPVNRQAWTLKRIHKLIVMSRIYRQASSHPQHELYSTSDPDNRLWWRAERRRLDADALRDSLLSVSGRLDLRQGGPGFRPTVSMEALEGLSRKTNAWNASPPTDQRRRSVYTYLQRSLLPPFLSVFDHKDTTLPCGQRDITTVAPQALSLLNNEFVHSQSHTLAERIAVEKTSAKGRAQATWQAVLRRAPNLRELRAALVHLKTQQVHFSVSSPDRGEETADVRALASLCHVLMNSNEFLYLD